METTLQVSGFRGLWSPSLGLGVYQKAYFASRSLGGYTCFGLSGALSLNPEPKSQLNESVYAKNHAGIWYRFSGTG